MGMDTIDTGCALGILMKRASKFGDGEGAIKMLRTMFSQTQYGVQFERWMRPVADALGIPEEKE